jgi:hypothetical protein
MEIEHTGSWIQGTHTSDGFFTFGGGPVKGAFRVRLTAINGAQVTDQINGIRKSPDITLISKNMCKLSTTIVISF